MKNKKNNQKPTPWLDKEQKIGLSNVFVGLTILGIYALLNYLFGKSDLSGTDALIIAQGTIYAVGLLLFFRKE